MVVISRDAVRHVPSCRKFTAQRHVPWRAVIFFFEIFLNEKSSRSRTKKVPCRFLLMKLKLVYCVHGNNMFRLHRFELEI